MIISAACRGVVNGEYGTFPVMRHGDFFVWMKLLHCNYNKAEIEQGFIDWNEERGNGKFISREEAAKLAYEYGQIKEPKSELFSEDLW